MQQKPVSAAQSTAAGAAPKAVAERIELFEYPSDPNAPYHPPAPGWVADGADDGDESAGGAAGFEQRLADETRRSFEAGRERGRQEERKALAAEQAAAREREKRQLAALIESFSLERDRYLHAVEQE